MEIVSVVILRKNGFPIMASILKTQKQYCLISPVPDNSLPNKKNMISTVPQHKDPVLMEEKKPTWQYMNLLTKRTKANHLQTNLASESILMKKAITCSPT